MFTILTDGVPYMAHLLIFKTVSDTKHRRLGTVGENQLREKNNAQYGNGVTQYETEGLLWARQCGKRTCLQHSQNINISSP